MSHGEFGKIHSLSLPIWSVLSLNSAVMEETWKSNMNFLCELTIVIPQLPFLLRIAKAISSTVELVNSVTSNSINSFHFPICAFANKWFPIELVRCSDGWPSNWWQMIHTMPGQLVSSIPQCKQDRHEEALVELLQLIRRLEGTFIEAYQAWEIICKVRSLKSRTKTPPFLEEIVTSSHEVFKHFESDITVGIR